MAVPRLSLADLPDWPRWLREEVAAHYVGVSASKFRVEVAAGIWPQPDRRGGVVCWDRKLLDAVSDKRSNIVLNDNDPVARTRLWKS